VRVVIPVAGALGGQGSFVFALALYPVGAVDRIAGHYAKRILPSRIFPFQGRAQGT
jgi:hypothetical protein